MKDADTSDLLLVAPKLAQEHPAGSLKSEQPRKDVAVAQLDETLEVTNAPALQVAIDNQSTEPSAPPENLLDESARSVSPSAKSRPDNRVGTAGKVGGISFEDDLLSRPSTRMILDGTSRRQRRILEVTEQQVGLSQGDNS
jgi:hypothetical protein